MQTLSKIELQNIFEYEDRLEINVSAKIKTSGLNRKKTVVVFRFFEENSRLCIASLIFFYINATIVFRGNNKSLIFTYQKRSYRKVALIQTYTGAIL
nr:unnamed protein product [Callosobruchus analis]